MRAVSSETTAAVLSAALGVVLLLLGRWGFRMGDSLVPGWRTPADREHAAAVHRRGARACVGAGVLMLVIAVAVLASPLFTA